MNSHFDSNDDKVIASVVDDAQRLSFLPRHFGNAMMRFEGAVYAHMGRLCRSYSGGFWTSHELSNGGCFMSPSVAAYRLESPSAFCETVSAPVAGIIATLYALSHLSFEFPDNEIYATRFHQLREFALDHPHADAILEAID